MTSPLVRILGVPMDLGQKRRGVDMGPSAVRYAGLQSRLERLGYDVWDEGNISVPVAEQLDDDPSQGKAYNAKAIGAVCRDIYAHARKFIDAGERLITLGGDHSVAIGTAAAAHDSPIVPIGRTAILWVDAHADFNTPQTTPSGNVHGMVVASLMGMCPPSITVGQHPVSAHQIAMIATRDLDTEERIALANSGILVYTMRQIDEKGMANVVREILAHFGEMERIHVSFDMDSLDPQIAHGVGTPVPGGLTYREAHLLMEMLADDGRVQSLDVVEINPILDDSNTTAKVALELIASLYGQRIL
jgi:arginase